MKILYGLAECALLFCILLHEWLEKIMATSDPLTGIAEGDPIVEPYSANSRDNTGIIWEVNGCLIPLKRYNLAVNSV